jgi:hypothetical protein
MESKSLRSYKPLQCWSYDTLVSAMAKALPRRLFSRSLPTRARCESQCSPQQAA